MSKRFIEWSDTFYSLPVIIDSRLPKPDQMRVEQDVLVELVDYRRVLLPANFLTDCHSTPPWSQSLLPAYNNRTNLAAIVHDYLYMNWEQHLEHYPELMDVDGRSYADGIYLELMQRFNPGQWRNRLYFGAVRAFGGWNWRKFRQQTPTA
ncbi:DUF1353 domain-containing protein [Spirosoma spitsbergense]|uniref:DUF1353 domain-containing protein n=1 Tax=Spirosoma spitsbergense TaxID=431554 RepID=UPI000380DB41|nr:DUF1353 domain-containing protein [Spirosoma spitsbergense]